MSQIKYYFLLCFLFCYNFGFSQGKAQLIVRAVATESGNQISWFPTDVEEWKNGMNAGYTISRQAENGNNASFKEQIILPKNQIWFKANVSPQSGVLYPIGEILYNPDFSLPTSGNNATWSIKYNYIVYEATQNQDIANALGLGFVDNSAVKSTNYTYTLKHNQSGLSQSITISTEIGLDKKVPLDFDPEFNFPDGNSLSYMNQLSKPFVLNAIIGKARPKLDSVVLRWGPSTSELWRNAMEDGYDIYRINEDNIRKKIATIFPWKADRFGQIPLTDSLALMAASFVKDKGQPQKMENENFYEKANMASNFHGFALMIADRSALAADILGLRYVDRDVTPGEIYIYEISTKRLNSNLPPIDIRVVNEYEPLLAPEGFSTIKGEKHVTLQWLSNSNLTKYGSYIVERAGEEDSVFQILTDPPLVFVREPSVSQPYYQFTDSLPNNKIVYRYRVRGSNAFGEWSEYGYALGFGVDKTPPNPVIIHRGDYEEDSTRLRLSWKLPLNLTDTKYHQVFLSELQDYNYSAVSVELLPTDTVFYFSVKDVFTDRPFYFKVMSVDSTGNQVTSVLRYVSVPDIEKPLPPENLKVTIDSTGLVSAVWSPSKSHDAEGYYIYYSNDDGNDLTMHNDFLYKDTIYTWKLPLNSLTKNIYIGVKTEDDNYNRSNISEIIKLRRPDTIPPLKPFLSQILLDADRGVQLNWKRSSATDVVNYIIYRKNNSDSIPKWITLDTISNENLEYFDEKYPLDTQLEYAIKASDDFNNISQLSNSLPINIPFPKNRYLINFKKVKPTDNMSVDIEWSAFDSKLMDIKTPFKYQIFRSTGNDELQLYKEFETDEYNFKDIAEMKNVLYNYAIRVKFEDSKVGTFSEVKSILIK